MKRLVVLLAAGLLLLCACSPLASIEHTATPEPEPFAPDLVVSDAAIFGISDVDAVFNGYLTLDDYAHDMEPQLYYWQTYDVTGDVYVQMIGESETAVVRILANDAAAIPLFKQEPSGDTTDMPVEIMGLNCLPAGMEWIAADTVFAPPRGVTVGDDVRKLIAAFRAEGTGDTELYKINALNPEATEEWISGDQYWLGAYIEIPMDEECDYYVVYSWAEIYEPLEKREYWHLFYTVTDDIIDSVTLSYDADLPDGYDDWYVDLPDADGMDIDEDVEE